MQNVAQKEWQQTVIIVYAPTLNIKEEAKGYFFDDLQGAIEVVLSENIVIVVGDWNARPGVADTATRHILS